MTSSSAIASKSAWFFIEASRSTARSSGVSVPATQPPISFSA
jgi:hypothetical protein